MSALDTVRTCWLGLASGRSCSAPASAAVLEEIERAYREPHRHYHTLDHIAAMLTLLDRYGEEAGDRGALQLAILFHDIVYDPRRQDNEAASAALASDRLTSLGFPGDLVAKVARGILATRHTEPPGAIGDPDLALLLDLDLSVLAARPVDYRAYAQAVRREYGFVPDPLYRPGRRRVLEGFLKRAPIYLTERLRGAWEQAARANLAAEIAELT
jgi:predicted metal-dependent HD superfamily phosphohydrolase